METDRVLRGLDPHLVGDLFYSKLFYDHPEVRALFPKDMRGQYNSLVDKFNLVVARLHQFEALKPEIEALARPEKKQREAIAHATRRTIRQNLAWAFVYNIIGIPLAALGFLSPIVAGAAMAFSSVSVVTNSALLTRWKPSNQK